MRRRNILLGTLAFAVVVTVISGVAYVLHARSQAQIDAKLYPGLHAPVSVVCPGPTYTTNGLGLPYRAEKSTPVIHPRNDCTPSFTQQDVRDYVAHGPFVGFGIGAEGSLTVTRVIFLTVRDFTLAVAPGDRSWEGNYPPDMLICYAGLSGTFSLTGGPDGGRYSVSSVSIVFDAHTGDQLVTIAAALLG